MKSALTTDVALKLARHFSQVLCLTPRTPANAVNDSVYRQLFRAAVDAGVEGRTRIWIFYENLESNHGQARGND